MPNTEHLEKLADVVRYHIKHDTPLDMSTWWHPCGTFGCLAGWAAQDAYFKRLGLKVTQGVYGANRTGMISFEGFPGILAVERLFDLDEHQAAYLFGNNPEITGADAIEDWHEALSRINEVIRGEV